MLLLLLLLQLQLLLLVVVVVVVLVTKSTVEIERVVCVLSSAAAELHFTGGGDGNCVQRQQC